MEHDEPHLERSLNPCCGYLTDSSDEIQGHELKRFTTPDPGDVAICINCGALLVYIDGPRNITKLAGKRDVAQLAKKDRLMLVELQRVIRDRGLIQPRGTG